MLSPEGQETLARYATRGWFDANDDPRLRDVNTSSWDLPRPAYLVIASGMLVLPGSSVQVTTRCNDRSFRCWQLAVMSEASRRFDLLDLKVGFRSQFLKDESLPLRDCIGEASPGPIQWPLETCKKYDEVSVCAIIPAPLGEEDPGALLEVILLGEVV